MEFKSLEEFWPFYVSQHLKPWTRKLHFLGTSLGLLCLAMAVIFKTLSFIYAGLIGSYGLAWIAHFFIEQNSPATFKYPAFSFRADFKMYGLMWQGKMDAELARLNIKSRH